VVESIAATPATPRALAVLARDEITYMADGRFHRLTSGPARPPTTAPALPRGVQPDRIESGPDPLMLIEWSDGRDRHHETVDPRRPAAQFQDIIAFDARDLRAYQRRAPWRGQDGWLRVVLGQCRADAPPSVRLDLGAPLQLLEALRWRTRAVLVGRGDLVELDLEALASRGPSEHCRKG
jgi:hypothetical protein